MADIKAATARIAKAKTKLDEIEIDIVEDRKAQEVTEAELRQTERDIKDASQTIATALADQKAIRESLARLDAEHKALKERRSELEKDNEALRKLER
jgi:chromosome segregation ATPase